MVYRKYEMPHYKINAQPGGRQQDIPQEWRPVLEFKTKPIEPKGCILFGSKPALRLPRTHGLLLQDDAVQLQVILYEFCRLVHEKVCGTVACGRGVCVGGGGASR